MTLNELTAKLYLHKSTASRVIDSLEQKGCVSRIVDPDDGRARILGVTKKGKELHSRIERELVDEMKQLLVDFDPDVRQATIRLFTRLVNTVKIRLR